MAGVRSAQASMGPPLYAAEDRLQGGHLLSGAASFNGAAALRGGRPDRNLRSASTYQCFNGAAALRGGRRMVRGCSSQTTSMLQWGRRSTRRKTSDDEADESRPQTLQWGRRSTRRKTAVSSLNASALRRFNGAAALRGGRHHALRGSFFALSASMGPPLYAAEDVERSAAERTHHAASMGPPLYAAEDRACPAPRSHSRCASMGPPLYAAEDERVARG